jgi:predicted GIY-YIG superfamily endonuclease
MENIYYIKNNNDVIYVGRTKDIKDRKIRHFGKKTSCKERITDKSEFVICESFTSLSMAEAYETALSCFFLSEGHVLDNKHIGRKSSQEYRKSRIGYGKGRIVSIETCKKISETKKKRIKDNPNLLNGLRLLNEDKKKKVYRSDGHIYSTTEECMKDLKISGTKFKTLNNNRILHKGFYISFYVEVI